MAKTTQTKTRAKTPQTPQPKSRMIRARVDPELKQQAESILKRLGLSSSEAIRLFYKQVALRGGLPFEVTVPNAATRKALEAAEAGQLTRYASVDEMFEDLEA